MTPVHRGLTRRKPRWVSKMSRRGRRPRSGSAPSAGPPPVAPWIGIAQANLYAWWDPQSPFTTDSGNPNYAVTSINNRSVLSGASSAQGTDKAKRAAPPAWPLNWTSTGYTQGTAGTPITNAMQNGSWSMAFRVDPQTGEFGLTITNDGDGNLRCRLYATRTQIGVHRQVTFPSPETYWTRTYSSLAAGRHTFGVSFARGGSSVATFYVDGVSVGTDTQTNRDLALGTTYSRISMNQGTQVFSGAGWWNTTLTGAQHAQVHAWLLSVDP